ncbi:16S rRNA (cytidine(1402)-2'-O)-methyltransferase [Candidatus Gottesmanbacteria bacterium]|nr:16S rRNA (cytidine(1402)-2'-O)-methyltransferase [Candidatus Gottesmanbacteria bacterium]
MGTLYLIATPIGNLKDITARAIETIFSVDYLLCEDTRQTGMLLKQFETKVWKKTPKLISFYDEVEGQKVPQVINLLQNGANIGLISDAGTPLLSDPGFKLVYECLKRKIKVISLPGASALLTGITSSGLPLNSFWFLGFPPSSQPKREAFFKALKNTLSSLPKNLSKPTVVFYEAPHRLPQVLEDFNKVFDDSEIVLARELTKIYEEVEKKKSSEWLKYFRKNKPQGEYVLLFTTRV